MKRLRSSFNPLRIVPFHKFRNKLILSFSVVILLMSFFMGYFYLRIMHTELEASTVESQTKIMEQSVNALGLHMQTIQNIGQSYFADTILQQFLAGERLIDNERYYRNKVQIQAMQSPIIANMTISDLLDYRLSSAYYYNPIIRGEIDHELSRTSQIARQNDGKPAWMISYTTTSNSLTLTRTISYVQELKRITPYSQEPIGFIKIDMDPVLLKNQFETLGTDDDAYYLVTKDGRIDFSNIEDIIGHDMEHDPLYQAYLAADASQTHFTFHDHGELYLGFSKPLADGEWTVLAKVHFSTLMVKLVRLRDIFFILGVTLIFGAIVLASLIAASVTKPLRTLNQNMKRVEMGDFDVAIPVTSRDEFRTIQISFNKMTAEIKGLITKVYEHEMLTKEAEIRALHSQMNPHFLYNTLGTIDSLATVHGEQQIPVICQYLSNILRYNLNGDKYAKLQEELDYLRQYFTIYQIRFGKEFGYEIRLAPSLANVIVPKFIIQPLVENAIIHGLEPKIGYKHIQVNIHTNEQNQLEICVSDNGVGISTGRIREVLEQLPKRHRLPTETSGRVNIGLANVYQRLEAYYGASPNFTINSPPGDGTIVTIGLPMQPEKE